MTELGLVHKGLDEAGPRALDAGGGKDISTQFMLAEYQDLYENVMHLESKLFNHLSFLTTLLTGMLAAAVATLGLVQDRGSQISVAEVIRLLAIPFGFVWFVCMLELRMTTELRIRKMQFVQGITQIREYFTERDDALRQYIALPVGSLAAPPYIRVDSHDWYQLVYVAALGAISLGIAIFCFFGAAAWLRSQNAASASTVSAVLARGAIIALSAATLWFLRSYLSAFNSCKHYDKQRESKLGRSTYELLDRPRPRNPLMWSLADLMRILFHRQ